MQHQTSDLVSQTSSLLQISGQWSYDLDLTFGNVLSQGFEYEFLIFSNDLQYNKISSFL